MLQEPRFLQHFSVYRTKPCIYHSLFLNKWKNKCIFAKRIKEQKDYGRDDYKEIASRHTIL